MSLGKVNKALRYLSINPTGGVLGLDDKISDGGGTHRTVREILDEKHPPGKPANKAICYKITQFQLTISDMKT